MPNRFGHVELKHAAVLFGITVDELGAFVSANAVHIPAVGKGAGGIFVGSLLEVMQ